MDVEFCLAALDEAIEQGVPEIFNTDQGAQFTNRAYTERLFTRGIEISMDGRAEPSTTSSSNGCGDLLNTKTFI